MANPIIYKNDTTGIIYQLGNKITDILKFPLPISDYFQALNDGDAFSMYEAEQHFKYRGQVIGSNKIDSGSIFNFVLNFVKERTNNPNYTLAVFNRFSTEGNISQNQVNDIYPDNNVSILNVGRPFTVQFSSTSSRTSSTIVPLDTGELLVFAKANVTLSNYNYEIVTTDEHPRMAVTMISSQIVTNPITGTGKTVNPPKSVKQKNKTVSTLPSFQLPSFGNINVKQVPKKLASPQIKATLTRNVVITPMTEIERARVLGERANHIADNFPVFIRPGKQTNSIQLANMEMEIAKTNKEIADKLNYIKVRRFNPNRAPGQPEYILVGAGDLLQARF